MSLIMAAGRMWRRRISTALDRIGAWRKLNVPIAAAAVNLIIIAPEEVEPAGTVTLTGARARHLTSVLRVAPGHTVRLGVLDGPFGSGVVESVDASAVTLHCVLDAAVPDPPAVDVLLALPRPKVLRRLWAQLAALGVGRILLTNAARVERNYFATHVLEPATYRPLLIEGLQQARATRLPQVSVHRQFRVLVEDHLAALSDAVVRVVADPAGRGSIRDVIAAAVPPPANAAPVAARRVLLAIGPEGGWNGFELDLLAAHGFQAATMGARTLRSDTACVALLALVHDALEDVVLEHGSR